MTITKYSPARDLDSMGALRFVEDTLSRLMSDGGARPWTPAVDILETENEFVLRADLPGVEQNEIDIRLENGTLTVKGERKFQQAEAGGYHRIERSFGSFARYFTLPDTLDPERVKADFRNGVLTVTLPKKELAKPRAVRVEVSQS